MAFRVSVEVAHEEYCGICHVPGYYADPVFFSGPVDQHAQKKAALAVGGIYFACCSDPPPSSLLLASPASSNRFDAGRSGLRKSSLLPKTSAMLQQVLRYFERVRELSYDSILLGDLVSWSADVIWTA
jgi:hypothetical protein